MVLGTLDSWRAICAVFFFSSASAWARTSPSTRQSSWSFCRAHVWPPSPLLDADGSVPQARQRFLAALSIFRPASTSSLASAHRNGPHRRHHHHPADVLGPRPDLCLLHVLRRLQRPAARRALLGRDMLHAQREGELALRALLPVQVLRERAVPCGQMGGRGGVHARSCGGCARGEGGGCAARGGGVSMSFTSLSPCACITGYGRPARAQEQHTTRTSDRSRERGNVDVLGQLPILDGSAGLLPRVRLLVPEFAPLIFICIGPRIWGIFCSSELGRRLAHTGMTISQPGRRGTTGNAVLD